MDNRHKFEKKFPFIRTFKNFSWVKLIVTREFQWKFQWTSNEKRNVQWRIIHLRLKVAFGWTCYWQSLSIWIVFGMMKRNCKGNRKCTNKKLFFTNIVTYITNIAGTLTWHFVYKNNRSIFEIFIRGWGWGGWTRGGKFTAFFRKKAGEGEESGKRVSHKNSNTLASRVIASYRAWTALLVSPLFQLHVRV